MRVIWQRYRQCSNECTELVPKGNVGFLKLSSVQNYKDNRSSLNDPLWQTSKVSQSILIAMKEISIF